MDAGDHTSTAASRSEPIAGPSGLADTSVEPIAGPSGLLDGNEPGPSGITQPTEGGSALIETYSLMSTSSSEDSQLLQKTSPRPLGTYLKERAELSSSNESDFPEVKSPKPRARSKYSTELTAGKDESNPVLISSPSTSRSSTAELPKKTGTRPRWRRGTRLSSLVSTESDPVLISSPSTSQSSNDRDLPEITRPRRKRRKNTKRSSVVVSTAKRSKKLCPVSGCTSQVVWLSRHFRRVHGKTKEQARSMEIGRQGDEKKQHKRCPVRFCSALVQRVDFHLIQVCELEWT